MLEFVQILFGATSICINCTAQACCWYHFFKCCGCIEDDRERQNIYVQPPPIQTSYIQDPNPFVHTGVPKDRHLEPAYK